MRDPEDPSDHQPGAGQVDSAHAGTPPVVVLAVRPDQRLDAVAGGLRARGLCPTLAAQPALAVRLAHRVPPAAVVIDARVPEWETLLVLLEAAGLPVVLLGTWRDLRQLEGRRGAAFGVVEPADPDDIVQAAALAAGTRTAPTTEQLDLGGVVVDLGARTVTVDDEEVQLPPKEFRILAELVAHRGRPVPARELIARVWPDAPWATPADLHWHVWRLRKRLREDRRIRPLIRTRRGYGYVIEVEPTPAAS